MVLKRIFQALESLTGGIVTGDLIYGLLIITPYRLHLIELLQYCITNLYPVNSCLPLLLR